MSIDATSKRNEIYKIIFVLFFVVDLITQKKYRNYYFYFWTSVNCLSSQTRLSSSEIKFRNTH